MASRAKKTLVASESPSGKSREPQYSVCLCPNRTPYVVFCKAFRTDTEQEREDIVEARARWRDGMTDLDVGALVFIDESGFDTKMTRLRGRSTRGQPCIGSVPHGHWRNNTFIAGLRSDRVDAPMLLPGAMNGDAFATWIEKALAPTLTAGDIVICDNLTVCPESLAKHHIRRAIRAQAHTILCFPRLSGRTLSVHKNAAARQAIEARGAKLLFLPAYSPDLNPIEMLFAKIKAIVRAIAPRDFDDLCLALKDALGKVHPIECLNYLKHAGYGPT